ncbi:DNA polymerase I [Candidatus Babeliales bacterium]|nr:DNA polymerase I [Candidatus Babeliales bacterium]
MTHRISQKVVFLVDGSSFLYRAYYGLKPLHTSKGNTVHAVYGFCRMIKKLIDDFDIKHLAIVWDSKGKTQRHEMFVGYKATRQQPPSDIFEQKELIQQFADIVGIAQISQVGHEADDLMYSAALKFNKLGYQAIIVTSDKDMRQVLCGNDILIFDPFKNIIMDEHDAKQRYGFDVEKLRFYFSILGDASDNIPGVKGIGKKGATELVQKFDSLADLYQNLDKVPKERTRVLLEQSYENAVLSLKLFELHEYEIDIHLKDVKFQESHWARALQFFKNLEFKSLVKQVELTFGQQQSLFVSSSDANEPKLHQKYQFISVVEEFVLQQLCDEIKKIKAFAIDTETNGFDPMSAMLVGVSVAYQQGQAYYIPLRHTQGQQISFEIFFKYFGPLLADENITKYMHHAKYDLLILIQAGFYVAGSIFDTMIASSLVTKEWEKNGLKELSTQFFCERMMTYDEVTALEGVKNFADVSIPLATHYAACDAHQTLKLVPVFEEKLKEMQMQELFYGIELAVNGVLVAMQQEGIFCDVDVLHHLSKQVDQDLQIIEKKIHTAAGKEINLNSPKQIRELLFDTLKLPPGKKSGSGDVYSTDAEVLKFLVKHHEIPLLLLAYRELFKLKSTYIDALPGCINKKTNRIHTSWNQTVVATGRISSSNPNLQNIPKNGLEYGKEYDVDVRSAFKAKTGWSFISADYSQIELRVLAQLSQDQNLLQAFKRGDDIHKQTAATMFDIAISNVTSAQRDIGKRINFSILYGLTPFGLSRDLDIELSDAKRYIDLYFAQYPGVQQWMQDIIEYVKNTGYTNTLYGRRRYIPGIYEANKTLYNQACRIAINTPAQGTAAEVIKIGMIKFFKALIDQKLDGKILLQIHDELLVTCPDDQIDQTVKLLEKCLVGAVDWSVDLAVTIRTGKNWRTVTK